MMPDFSAATPWLRSWSRPPSAPTDTAASIGRRGAWMRLGALAGGMELVYILYFVRQFPLLQYYRQDVNIGDITSHAHGALVLFIVAVTLLFLLFAVACFVGARLGDARSLWLVLGLGALFAVTLTFVYPITSTDMFSYINQSRILVHYHQNPLITAPAAFPADPLMYRAPAWRTFPAPYGPLAVLLDALPMLPAGANVLANLLLLKLMYSGMALGCAATVYHIVRRTVPGYAALAAMLVAWNPLVLLETSVNGHNDIAMMLLTLVALLAVVTGRTTAGPVLLVAASLVKYSSLVLLPLFVAFGLYRQPTRRDRVVYVAVTGLRCFALALVAYAPFWHGFHTFSSLTYQTHRYSDSFSRALIDLVPAVSPDQAALLGWIVFIGAYNYALWLASGNEPDLIRGCYAAMLAFVAFAATNVQVWYVLWPALLAATLPRRAELASAGLLTYGATLSPVCWTFLFVWWGSSGGRVVDVLSYSLTFVPATLVYLTLSILPELRERRATN